MTLWQSGLWLEKWAASLFMYLSFSCSSFKPEAEERSHLWLDGYGTKLSQITCCELLIFSWYFITYYWISKININVLKFLSSVEIIRPLNHKNIMNIFEQNKIVLEWKNEPNMAEFWKKTKPHSKIIELPLKSCFLSFGFGSGVSYSRSSASSKKRFSKWIDCRNEWKTWRHPSPAAPLRQVKTVNLNKDWWRVSTSSHSTKTKPKYSG